MGATVKFAMAVLVFTLGYAVFYYAMYMLASYDPGAPQQTHAIPMSVLLGRIPDLNSSDPNTSMYASPPFSY